MAASAWLAVHFYTKKLQEENAALQKQVTHLKTTLPASELD